MRTFFTSPTAVEGEEDSAKMLASAVTLRGMQAPDVWVPDNEDATASSMRNEGIVNIIEIVSEHGADFPGEIHPRMVWHRDDPGLRRQGLEHMIEVADPNKGAIRHIDGFVIPEVGDIDDWKKADECFTIVEDMYDLQEGSLSMSVIIESATAELALADLRNEIGKPSNNLERLFMLIDGEVDYTKDMRAMTPTGGLPPWPELRHNTSRGASANALIAVDGPFDDIRNLEGYRARMTENRAKGINGIWSLTPSQVHAANIAPLPPETGKWLLDLNNEEVTLDSRGEQEVYPRKTVSLRIKDDDAYVLITSGEEEVLKKSELQEKLEDATSYIPSMSDIVESMEEFESAKAAGKGAIAMTQSVTVVIDDVEIEISKDRMWDEATYQAAQTPIKLFQDVYRHRSDQHEELVEMYGQDVVKRATEVGD